MIPWRHLWDGTIAGWRVWVMQRGDETVVTATCWDPYRFRQVDAPHWSRPWIESWLAAMNRERVT